MRFHIGTAIQLSVMLIYHKILISLTLAPTSSMGILNIQALVRVIVTMQSKSLGIIHKIAIRPNMSSYGMKRRLQSSVCVLLRLMRGVVLLKGRHNVQVFGH